MALGPFRRNGPGHLGREIACVRADWLIRSVGVSLSGVDYLVIGAYLVAITLFGSWFARYQKTTRDYFLTDRSVPWWAICFTIVATETSTLTFIGIPAQAYAGNMTFLQLAIGYIIGRVLVSVL